MRLPFFRAIIYSFSAVIACALAVIACALAGVASAVAGVAGPIALSQQGSSLSQQGSSLPEIQQNQPQMVAPLRATIVDRDLPGGRENGSQGGWSAFQEETAPTGFDPDRRSDSNVVGVRNFNSSPLPGNRENAFSSDIGGIPVRTSVSEGTRLNERGLNERGLNEDWANEQGAGNVSGSQWQGTGRNQTGFAQPQSNLPAVQGLGGQSPPSARDSWQPPGNTNLMGGQLPQISNLSVQSNRGTSQGNFDSPLVNLPNNGMIAPGSRTLQNDRMDRPDRAVSTPSGDTLLAHQRQVGDWDWSISLPEGSNSRVPLPRAGR